MSRLLLPFAAAMLALGALAWVLAASWPSVTNDVRAGIFLAVVAGVGGLAVKSQALRRGVKGALAWTVALFFGRMALWGGGALWWRAHGGNAAAFTAGFCAVFAVELLLEVSFILVASRRRQRGTA